MRSLAWIVLMLAPSCAAYGSALKPPEIQTVIKAARPYGGGSYSWAFITAYDAALWTDAPQWSMQTPFALTLSYHLSFSSDEIVARSLKEMKKDDPALSDATLARYQALMGRLFPGVKSGDEITGLYVPGRGTQFFHNGRLTGEDKGDAAFANAFFGIWLSPQTSDPALRAELLHVGQGKT